MPISAINADQLSTVYGIINCGNRVFSAHIPTIGPVNTQPIINITVTIVPHMGPDLFLDWVVIYHLSISVCYYNLLLPTFVLTGFLIKDMVANLDHSLVWPRGTYH